MNITDLIQKRAGSNDFSPTDAHRRAKAAFWSHFERTGDLPPTQIDLALGLRLSGYEKLAEYWDAPGFQTWFQNRDEFRQKAEYLSLVALEKLESVIRDDASKTGDKLAAAKMILELSSKFPKQSPNEKSDSADKKIGDMNREQLEEFISGKLKIVNINK